ncbi:hypothetical protein Tco_0573459 [Tanacetum coccineum]
MNQNYDPNFCYNPIYSGFDQIQPQQFSTVQLLEIERINKEESFKKKDMSIEEIMSEKRLIDDEIKDITNDLSYKRFRGEKIDDEYERDCEIKINQLLQDYNGLDIEMRKKERVLMEEKYLAVSQRIKSICNYDDDEDDSIPLRDIIARYSPSVAITSSPPVLPTREPEDSLIMGDEHLDTIPEKESDELIKSSVENLVPIPSESEDFSDNETSPFNLEYDSLEEVNEDQEEKKFDLEDIFQIQDVILLEKLVKISCLITNIESLKNNPTPNFVFKSPSSFPIPVVDSDSFFEESNTSLSHSGWLTSVVISNHSNDPLLELPEFESFHFDPSFTRPPPEPPDVEISLIIETDALVINNFDELNEDECFDPGGGEINVEVDNSFTFVTWIFLPYLTYPEVSPLLSSARNEDTIFDPGIST